VLGEFSSWWTGRMLEFVPESIRRRRRDLMDALVLRPAISAATSVTGFTISQRRRRRERQIGYFEPGQTDGATMAKLSRARQRVVALRLPAALLLRLRVKLPLADEPDLDSVLRRQMDRITPFRPDEIFWSWRINRRDRARDLLEVTICLVPRASLEPGLTALAGAGIAPTRLEIGQAGEVSEVVTVPPPASHARSGHRAKVLLAAFCGALAVVALVLPYVLQANDIAAVNAAIVALEPGVAHAKALRQRIDSNAASRDAIVTEEARLGDVLQTLAAVTGILPDDTYLTRLTSRQHRLTITGRSAAAAGLIATLAADPAIRNPAFTGPVTRIGTDTTDLFVIRADLVP
jgi:general secretion pathway protein L